MILKRSTRVIVAAVKSITHDILNINWNERRLSESGTIQRKNYKTNDEY